MTGGADDRPVITSYAAAPNKAIIVGGIRLVYRDLGRRDDIPVVFFTHLAGTLDTWDPRLIDAVALHRRVIAFDQQGVGGSSGKVPKTLEKAADDAFAFIAALGFAKIDVFGFSMGGMIAQDLIVKYPTLVRKLVLAGTGPRGGKDIEKVISRTYWDVLRAALTFSDPKEFLFFHRNATGRRAGKAFISRLKERTSARDQRITLSAFQTQLNAIAKYGRAAPADLSVITGPTLIANGADDHMVPSVLSYDLHERIINSELIIYQDSGHGGIFQYWEAFTLAVSLFLSDNENVLGNHR